MIQILRAKLPVIQEPPHMRLDVRFCQQRPYFQRGLCAEGGWKTRNGFGGALEL